MKNKSLNKNCSNIQVKLVITGIRKAKIITDKNCRICQQIIQSCERHHSKIKALLKAYEILFKNCNESEIEIYIKWEGLHSDKPVWITEVCVRLSGTTNVFNLKNENFNDSELLNRYKRAKDQLKTKNNFLVNSIWTLFHEQMG